MTDMMTIRTETYSGLQQILAGQRVLLSEWLRRFGDSDVLSERTRDALGRQPPIANASGEHPKMWRPMSLDTKVGDTVEYMDCNGHAGQREVYRRLGLRRGVRYTVYMVDVGDSYSCVYLNEFMEKGGFNSVCFCNVEAP